MPAFITFGRVLFAVLFIVSGAFKLLDIAGTTQMITDKVIIPGLLTPYTTQLEGMSGMPMPQMLAIATGALEVICGLMIAFGIGHTFEEEEELIPVEAGHDTARTVPGARLLLVEGMGHSFPREVWPVIIDAIAQHASAAELR